MDLFGKKKKGIVKKEERPAAGSGTSGTDLAAFMARIEQRLNFIEKKLDVLTGRAPAKSFEARSHVATVPSADAGEAPRSPEQTSAPRQGRGRRERTLHQAVCADCRKDCQIPFKPSGERPVYCKECFSKRKAGNPSKAPNVQETEAAPEPEAVPEPEVRSASVTGERKVTVTKKGVGKVVISEIARPGSRDAAPRGRTSGPERKSRR